jgi:hypothetical protein
VVVVFIIRSTIKANVRVSHIKLNGRSILVTDQTAGVSLTSYAVIDIAICCFF